MRINRKTIKKEITFKGIGIHTGKETTLSLKPSSNGKIEIFRKDLNITIPLSSKNIYSDEHCSEIRENDVKIMVLEHLLSVLHVFNVTDLIIEMDTEEVPIFDGSPLEYAKKISEVGIQGLTQLYEPMTVSRKITFEKDDKSISIEPNDKLIVDYRINFPHPLIGNSKLKIEITKDIFMKELSNARTFGRMKDVEEMKAKGLALGATMENGIALDDEKVLNESGLRYPDEFIRHKIIDLIGDLYFEGIPVRGKVIAKLAGHELHHGLIKSMVEAKTNPNPKPIVPSEIKDTEEL